MKDIISTLHDASGSSYILLSLILRAAYDWERTSIGQKIRQFCIGLMLALLVNKVYLDVYGLDAEMMKYIGVAVFSCAFLGEIALDIFLKKMLYFLRRGE